MVREERFLTPTCVGVRNDRKKKIHACPVRWRSLSKRGHSEPIRLRSGQAHSTSLPDTVLAGPRSPALQESGFKARSSTEEGFVRELEEKSFIFRAKKNKISPFGRNVNDCKLSPPVFL